MATHDILCKVRQALGLIIAHACTARATSAIFGNREELCARVATSFYTLPDSPKCSVDFHVAMNYYQVYFYSTLVQSQRLSQQFLGWLSSTSPVSVAQLLLQSLCTKVKGKRLPQQEFALLLSVPLVSHTMPDLCNAQSLPCMHE